MVNHEEYEKILDKGMAIAAEHFAENELFICKGRVMTMENIVKFLSVSVKTARADFDRTKDAEGVLNTLLNSMDFMREEYEKSIVAAPHLISKSMSRK